MPTLAKDSILYDKLLTFQATINRLKSEYRISAKIPPSLTLEEAHAWRFMLACEDILNTVIAILPKFDNETIPGTLSFAGIALDIIALKKYKDVFSPRAFLLSEDLKNRLPVLIDNAAKSSGLTVEKINNEQAFRQLLSDISAQLTPDLPCTQRAQTVPGIEIEALLTPIKQKIQNIDYDFFTQNKKDLIDLIEGNIDEILLTKPNLSFQISHEIIYQLIRSLLDLLHTLPDNLKQLAPFFNPAVVTAVPKLAPVALLLAALSGTFTLALSPEASEASPFKYQLTVQPGDGDPEVIEIDADAYYQKFAKSTIIPNFLMQIIGNYFNDYVGVSLLQEFVANEARALNTQLQKINATISAARAPVLLNDPSTLGQLLIISTAIEKINQTKKDIAIYHETLEQCGVKYNSPRPLRELIALEDYNLNADTEIQALSKPLPETILAVNETKFQEMPIKSALQALIATQSAAVEACRSELIHIEDSHRQTRDSLLMKYQQEQQVLLDKHSEALKTHQAVFTHMAQTVLEAESLVQQDFEDCDKAIEQLDQTLEKMRILVEESQQLLATFTEFQTTFQSDFEDLSFRTEGFQGEIDQISRQVHSSISGIEDLRKRIELVIPKLQTQHEAAVAQQTYNAAIKEGNFDHIAAKIQENETSIAAVEDEAEQKQRTVAEQTEILLQKSAIVEKLKTKHANASLLSLQKLSEQKEGLNVAVERLYAEACVIIQDIDPTLFAVGESLEEKDQKVESMILYLKSDLEQSNVKIDPKKYSIIQEQIILLNKVDQLIKRSTYFPFNDIAALFRDKDLKFLTDENEVAVNNRNLNYVLNIVELSGKKSYWDEYKRETQLPQNIEYAKFKQARTELLKKITDKVTSLEKELIELDKTEADIRLKGNQLESLQSTSKVLSENSEKLRVTTIAIEFLQAQNDAEALESSNAQLKADLNLFDTQKQKLEEENEILQKFYDLYREIESNNQEISTEEARIVKQSAQEKFSDREIVAAKIMSNQTQRQALEQKLLSIENCYTSANYAVYAHALRGILSSGAKKLEIIVDLTFGSVLENIQEQSDLISERCRALEKSFENAELTASDVQALLADYNQLQAELSSYETAIETLNSDSCSQQFSSLKENLSIIEAKLAFLLLKQQCRDMEKMLSKANYNTNDFLFGENYETYNVQLSLLALQEQTLLRNQCAEKVHEYKATVDCLREKYSENYNNEIEEVNAKYEEVRDLHTALTQTITEKKQINEGLKTRIDRRFDELIGELNNYCAARRNILDNFNDTEEKINQIIAEIQAYKISHDSVRLLSHISAVKSDLLGKNISPILAKVVKCTHSILPDEVIVPAVPQFDTLIAQIGHMKTYGQSIGGSEGQVAIDLADELQHEVNEFKCKKPEFSNEELEVFKVRFTYILHSQDAAMEHHRAYWKVIVANIALALTVIGTVAVLGKLLWSKHGFFNTTARKIQVEKIDQVLRASLVPGAA